MRAAARTRSVAVLVMAVATACSAPPAKPAPKPPTTAEGAGSGAGSGSAAGPATKPVIENPVAAHVGIDIITLATLDRYVDARARDVIEREPDPAMRTYRRARERARWLPELIDEHLLEKAATRARMEATDDEVTRALEEVKRANNLTDQQLADVVKQTGMTLEEYRTDIRNQIRVARYLNYQGKANETPEQRKRRVADELRAATTITVIITEPPPPANLPRKLDASGLLARADLEGVLGHVLPEYEVLRSELDADSPNFDSIHFKATGKSESHDIMVRVWKHQDAELDKRWADLDALPNTKKGRELGDASLRSSNKDAFGQGFIDRKASVVVLVVCGAAVCKKADEVLAIAKLVQSRLAKLQ